MALLTGEDQDYQAIEQADFVFAMITMISRDDVLGRFRPEDFQIAVLDEVHHAAAASYQKVTNYFKQEIVQKEPVRGAVPYAACSHGSERYLRLSDKMICRKQDL